MLNFSVFHKITRKRKVQSKNKAQNRILRRKLHIIWHKLRIWLIYSSKSKSKSGHFDPSGPLSVKTINFVEHIYIQSLYDHLSTSG